MQSIQKRSLKMALAVILLTSFSLDVQAQRGGNRGGAGAGGGRGGDAGAGRGAGGQGGGRSGGMGRGGSSGGPRATGGGIGQSSPGANEAGRGDANAGFQNSLDQIRATGPKSGTNTNRNANPRTDTNRNDPNRGDLNNRVNPGRADGVRGVDNANIDRYGDHAFSNDWYGAHPDAWRYNNGNTNIYAMAGPGNMNSWWGAPGVGGVGGVAPVGGGGGVAAAPASGSNSQETANNAKADSGEWLPIGVFTLTPKGQTEVTRAVQLATDHNGAVKGNHIDLLSDTNTEVHGRYDEKAKTVEWTIGQSNSVVFKAKVDDFNDSGKPVPVVAQYADGSNASWTMTPVQNPSASDEKPKNGE